jgi:hypothetical protein
MSKAYDVIVVGARCAGSPTGMLLARNGYDVLLVDRATFPSDMMSTHLIHPPGVAALKRWGVLEQLRATGCPPMTTYAYDMGPIVITGSPRPAEGVPEAFCPRRTVLDELLVRAAAAAGAELREGFTVDEILVEDGVVTGVRGHETRGGTVTERARVVVEADGRNSLVAKAVGAKCYNAVPAQEATYYAYWSGLEMDRAELFLRAGTRGARLDPSGHSDAHASALRAHAARAGRRHAAARTAHRPHAEARQDRGHRDPLHRRGVRSHGVGHRSRSGDRPQARQELSAAGGHGGGRNGRARDGPPRPAGEHAARAHARPGDRRQGPCRGGRSRGQHAATRQADPAATLTHAGRRRVSRGGSRRTELTGRAPAVAPGEVLRLAVAVRAEELEVLEAVVLAAAVDVVQGEAERLAVPLRDPAQLARVRLDAHPQ